MMFWASFALAWCFLSVFLALLIGACLRAGRGDDGHLSSEDYWRDVQ